MKRPIVAGLLLLASMSAAAQPRLASDFEIAQMREQIARSPDFLSQLSARLNLGDLHATRSEIVAAREEYRRALSIATSERVNARRDSDLASYATTTAYAALAHAKLDQPAQSFALLEEAVRYSSDSAKTWNLYATAMTILRKPQKSVPAARNAVTIATADAGRAPSTASRLDLAIYQHSLATALIDADDQSQAKQLLQTVVESLAGPAFETLRRRIERSESFEVYSTARGEAAAYLSLLNRSQLRLAALFEREGDRGRARETYARVLERRSDDVTALAGLARLSEADEQARYFAAAFDANPFALPLVRSYQRHLASGGRGGDDPSTAGGAIRQALGQMQRGETGAARTSLDKLLGQFPGNATLQLLRRELDASARAPLFLSQTSTEVIDPAAADLRHLASLAAAGHLTPEQRSSLDTLTFVSTVMVPSVAPGGPGQTVIDAGTIGSMPFRFTQPTVFTGSFPSSVPLRLRYRFLGAIEVEGMDALLLEPLHLEVIR